MSRTEWYLQGVGYEFCNCAFGCGCNFAGVPNSKDGSCRALVGTHILQGACGGVDLSDVKCAAIVEWPKAIHEGNGKAVFVVDPATTDAQVDALGQIFTGRQGGLPWEFLGPTFEVIGLVRAPIAIEGGGVRSRFVIDGVGEGRGEPLKNPVTCEDHAVNVDLPDGFIWTHGACGRGSFRATAGGLSLDFEGTNWIHYRFDWSNLAEAA